ncbi:MAG TPA: diguanylate cyclase [Microthrixaceae bacterium]|jgi:PAS domain S-box-containing protein/diguanylate cyclase (GGDEF)-like protein|nr:diguanylate cyclase [Microthrixaceae bacterium]
MSDRGPSQPQAGVSGSGTDVGTVDAVRRILDAADVPTATLDGEGQILSLNPSFARLCGRALSEIAGLHLLALCPGRDQAEVLSKLVRIVGAVSDIEQEQLRVTGADGRVRTLSLTLGGLTGADGRCERVVAIAADLSEERRSQRRRRRQAVEQASGSVADEQTGLPNQRALPVLIGSALRRSGSHDAPFALLRCTVVNLDEIERTHGSEATRAAMSALSERLVQRLRSADTVTRTSTDAFTVIAEDLGDAQDAAGVAYRLLASVVEDVNVFDHAVAIDMVIGIAVGDSAAIPDALIRDAARASIDARSDGVGGFRMVDRRGTAPTVG